MKIKQLLTKSLLVAVALLGGASSVWAETWDFTNTTTWTAAKLIANKMYNASGEEVVSGGVAIKFTDGQVTLSSGIRFEVDGTSTQPDGSNYLQIAVPAGYRLTVNNTTTSSRYMYYSLDGTDGTTTGTQLKNNTSLVYNNETTSSVVFTIWPGNTQKTNYPGQLKITSIVLEESVATHGYTVTAKCGNTMIGSWSGSDIDEGSTYNVPAKAYINYNDKLYILNDAKYTQTSSYNYSYSTTMGDADENWEISYDEYTAGDIVAFAEGEDFSGANVSAGSTSSGGKYANYVKNLKTFAGLSTSAVYRLETVVRSRETSSSLEVFYEGGTSSIAQIAKNGSLGYRECYFIPEQTTVGVAGPYYSDARQNSLGFDYVIIRKICDITDAANIVGAIDFTSAANSVRSSNYTMKKGDTKVFTFQNHGTTYGNNWRIEVKEGETWKSNTCADSYDYTAGAATNVTSYKMSTDGGSSKVSLNWDKYAEDMADANCVATLTYKDNGTLEIRTTSTGAKNSYIYYVDNDVTGLTGDLTINLSVCNSWLEVLSVEQTTVGAAIGSTGYTTFASSYPLNIDGMTASTGTVKAYYVTASDVKSSSVALTGATGNVAAETGLILEGTADATITIPVAASGTDLSTTNMLVGCTANTDITTGTANYANFYVLSATAAAFKNIKNWVAAPNTLTIPAGKAYLDTTGADVVGAPTLNFDLSGEATGISEIKTMRNAENEIFFDLQGRKVAQPAKGLYIQNGRKVILK